MTSLYATKNWPYQVNAGGAVYKVEDSQRHYALLIKPDERTGQETHHLPKGVVESTETLEAAALREIKEETGLLVEIRSYLGGIHNAFQAPVVNFFIDRTAHYFLALQTGGDSKDMDHEHLRLEWYTADEATELLKAVPKHEDEIIKRAEQWFKAFS